MERKEKSTDQYAEAKSKKSLVGPEPACGIPWSAIKQALKIGPRKQHDIYWKDTPGH
jgi:hypothetical protein